MARIRTIKPELPQSESMGRVSREARYCFIMLWTVADDSGRLRGNSRMLASLLFPYDNDAPELIDGWLDELEKEACVIRYAVDGNNYIQIVNWLIHQKIDKPSTSKIPEFDESSRTFSNASGRIKEGIKEGIIKTSVISGKQEDPPLPPKGKFVLPDWIPSDLWADYLEARKVLKSPMTDRAKQLAVKKLDELRTAGFQPGDVLGQSIYNGWKGLFPLKESEKKNDWRSEVIYGG